MKQQDQLNFEKMKVPRGKQVKRLVERMNSGVRITSLQGWRILGISYLPQAINKAKKQGYVFQEKNKTVENRFSEKCSIKVWWFDKQQ